MDVRIGFLEPKRKLPPFWPFFLAVILALIITVIIFSQAHAETVDVERLADAIYKTENSVKYPYGIKSINTHGDKIYARKVCINSIRNALKRWDKAGRPEDFIAFMGRRYSPPNINPNWVRLVKYFYSKAKN